MDDHEKALCYLFFFFWQNGWNNSFHSKILKNDRVWMAWDEGRLEVNLVWFSTQTITCRVFDKTYQKWFYVTGVYGFNDRVPRYALWDDLCHVSRMVSDQPWVLFGDFNIVRCADERLGGAPPSVAEMRDFNDCLNNINVVEMNTKGFMFTWDNKRDDDENIKSRINRAFYNEAWLQCFPNVEAEAVIGGKPFKFFDYWMRHNDFGDVVNQSWCQPIEGFAMYKVTIKLRRLKTVLRKFNANHYCNITVRVKEAYEELKLCQSKMQNFRVTADMRCREKELLVKYVNLREAEEDFFRQKSRVKWLHSGDRNTVFFHRKVRVNRAHNKVMSITGADGQRIEGEEAVHKEAIRHFSVFLGQADPVVQSENVSVRRKLSHAQSLEMVKEITNDDIRRAMFSINAKKSTWARWF